MGALTREAILEANDLRLEKVHVPEWGGDVWLRVMTGTERDNFERSVMKNGKLDSLNIRAKFAALVIVGEDGSRLFNDRDVTALGGKSAAALDRVLEAGQRLNGFSDEDVAELGKASGEASSDDSPSD